MRFLPVSYVASQADVAVFKAISEAPAADSHPHVARWYTHIKSYTAEFDSLPGSSTAGEAFLGAAAAAKEEEDDDEVDLFGSDEEEDAEFEYEDDDIDLALHRTPSRSPPDLVHEESDSEDEDMPSPSPVEESYIHLSEKERAAISASTIFDKQGLEDYVLQQQQQQQPVIAAC